MTPEIHQSLLCLRRRRRLDLQQVAPVAAVEVVPEFPQSTPATSSFECRNQNLSGAVDNTINVKIDEVGKQASLRFVDLDNSNQATKHR